MAAILLIGCTGCGSKKSHVRTITNVSYDPTREFYEAYNPLFEKYYKEKTGKEVNIIQSHGGSGAQARSVVEGCNADVVTLALEHDITLIEQTGLIEKGWEQEFADDSSPYTSTIVFLVRKGNPKQIKDWDDLVNKKVEIITPDPKSSGGACWNFLAALSYIKEQTDDEKEQKAFLQKLYSQVSVMDSGARGSTTTFVENQKGDVLIAWENEQVLIYVVVNEPNVADQPHSVFAQNIAREILEEVLPYMNIYPDEKKTGVNKGYDVTGSKDSSQYTGKHNGTKSRNEKKKKK